jgi:hypothetical protein
MSDPVQAGREAFAANDAREVPAKFAEHGDDWLEGFDAARKEHLDRQHAFLEQQRRQGGIA